MSSTRSPTRTFPARSSGLSTLLDAGHDPRRVTEDLLATSRDAFLLVSAKGRVRIDAPADQAERLTTFGEHVGPALLVRVLETLGQAVVDMRGTDAADPRLVLEIALVRLARRDAGPPVQVLIERIERLERAVADGATGSARPSSDTPAPAAPARRTGSLGAIRHERARSSPTARTRSRRATRPSRRRLRRPPKRRRRPGPRPTSTSTTWSSRGPTILPSFSPATRAAAQDAQPIAYEAGVITFGIPARLHKSTGDRFRTQADAIRAALSERLGGTMKFKLEPHDGFEGFEDGGGGRPVAPPPPAPSADPSPEPPLGEAPPPDDDEILDLSELVDADDADPAGDSVAKFTQSFDATVVEEVPRD